MFDTIGEIGNLPEHEQHEDDCINCHFGIFIEDKDPWWLCNLKVDGKNEPPIYCHWQPIGQEGGA